MWTPERIRGLRRLYGESQPNFAARLRVNVWTVRHWEQGKGRPLGPAELLLDRLQEDVEAGKVRDIEPADADEAQKEKGEPVHA